MKITIKNYRGIEEGEIDLERIALVAGPNFAGKSSVALATASALRGQAVCIPDLKKGEAGLLLREGAKRGRCTIEAANGSSIVNWPGGTTSSEGTPPKASAIACGLESLAEMKGKDATLAIIKATGSEPTEQQLAAALVAAELPTSLVPQLWKSIQDVGWDQTHARAAKKATERKGAWEHVTGERYGGAKAAGWRAPASPDDTNGLEELAHEQREALEAAMANRAVGEAEVTQLRQRVESGQAAAKLVATLEVELAAARAHEQDLATERQALPAPEDEERSTPCPHCSQPVVVAGGQLRAPSAGLSPEENAARREKIQATTHGLRVATDRTGDINSRLIQNRSLVDGGKRAAERLEAIPEGGTTEDQVLELRQALQATEAAMAGAKRTAEARVLHERIEEGQRLIEILAPTGLRQTALAEAMAEFNAGLAALSERAGWPATSITAEMEVRFGDRPYLLLADSEKFRARVVLQLAIAERDGSDAVIIDASDILDKKGRNGLIGMLKESQVPAMVCMTFSQGPEAPDLAKAGIGRTYWIGDGFTAQMGR